MDFALRERRTLSRDIRRQLKAKLVKRLEHPRVPASRLYGMSGCNKIKLRASGYRLIDQVHDKVLVVTVIPVGKPDKGWLIWRRRSGFSRKTKAGMSFASVERVERDALRQCIFHTSPLIDTVREKGKFHRGKLNEKDCCRDSDCVAWRVFQPGNAAFADHGCVRFSG